jgi:GT2 family glycosyltransferase
LLIAGNDIAVYPNTIDTLIKFANESDWDWISSSQFDSKTLVNAYPETAKYFNGTTLVYNAFGERPWEIHHDWDREHSVSPNVIKDVHNLCLYKKSVMDSIGYIDVGFYPAYYSDNDYARRGVNAELKTCALNNSVYFHFWSRTIHQGNGGSTGRFFDNNRRFYKMKWGGDFASEAWRVPFNGKNYFKSGWLCWAIM